MARRLSRSAAHPRLARSGLSLTLEAPSLTLRAMPVAMRFVRSNDVLK